MASYPWRGLSSGGFGKMLDACGRLSIEQDYTRFNYGNCNGFVTFPFSQRHVNTEIICRPKGYTSPFFFQI
jgi:hypothetical protein